MCGTLCIDRELNRYIVHVNYKKVPVFCSYKWVIHRRINRTFLNCHLSLKQWRLFWYSLITAAALHLSVIIIHNDRRGRSEVSLGLQLVGDWFLDRPSINSMNNLNCDNMWQWSLALPKPTPLFLFLLNTWLRGPRAKRKHEYNVFPISPKNTNLEDGVDISYFLSSFVEFRSEEKSKMSQPIRVRGGHLVFPIGPINTNFVEEVDILLPVKFRRITRTW